MRCIGTPEAYPYSARGQSCDTWFGRWSSPRFHQTAEFFLVSKLARSFALAIQCCRGHPRNHVDARRWRLTDDTDKGISERRVQVREAGRRAAGPRPVWRGWARLASSAAVPGPPALSTRSGPTLEPRVAQLRFKVPRMRCAKPGTMINKSRLRDNAFKMSYLPVAASRCHGRPHPPSLCVSDR